MVMHVTYLTTLFNQPMSDTRLIERWLPISALGEESVRERRSMTALPPTYYLHVWWARRPLVASRAAILASLLPADADREKFLHVLGIHGDPVSARKAVDNARRTGQRVSNPYGYDRAFKYSPTTSDLDWLKSNITSSLKDVKVCDPTAGRGSIPFEVTRLGMWAMGNDLNPVAAFILKATVEWPTEYSSELRKQLESLTQSWRVQLEERLGKFFPQKYTPDRIDQTYLWARTIICPYCAGLIPMSPNWRLAPDGTGIRLNPNVSTGPGAEGRICSFEIIDYAKGHSNGTVSHGDVTCPFPDCRRVVDSEEIKRQAQAGQVGEQLYAIVYKECVPGKSLKSGKKGKDRWIRGYRPPEQEDENSAEITRILDKKFPEWGALDLLPREEIPDGYSTSHPKQYGVSYWTNLFSPRQLLCHGTSVEVFREMVESDLTKSNLSEIHRAAYGYLALVIDTMLNYNNRCCRWDSTTCRVRSNFDRHDFAFLWSYGEMAPLANGAGIDWATQKTAKCISELSTLIYRETDGSGNLLTDNNYTPPPITISCKSGDSLDHIEDKSIDAVVMDPPYYDNVMYAELSDFFYVWLKRTAGYVYPELFRRNLTDKDNEAVANPARFKGKKGAKALAGREYQDRMASIFAEFRRVLKPDGIMTLMFTHKATGAWDALTKGLIEAGFTITASWPIKTEAEGSLHIRNKAAANSTVFLACRPRSDHTKDKEIYWEDVEPYVAKAVRERVEEFQEAGITGVDLYLSSFGPALETFSRHWPLKRGTPRENPKKRKSQQLELFEDDWDPYLVTPEDALLVARREVKQWRLEKLTDHEANPDLDAPTAFFVLAWDAFRAPKFAYDEALQLARAVGADLDREIIGRLAKKDGSNIVLWDSVTRAAKGSLGSPDGSRGMIDAIHHGANLARTRSLEAARELHENTKVDQNPNFITALEAVLEVLPISTSITGINLEGEVAGSGDDFEALYKLCRLAYREQINKPKQLEMFEDNT